MRGAPGLLVMAAALLLAALPAVAADGLETAASGRHDPVCDLPRFQIEITIGADGRLIGEPRLPSGSPPGPGGQALADMAVKALKAGRPYTIPPGTKTPFTLSMWADPSKLCSLPEAR